LRQQGATDDRNDRTVAGAGRSLAALATARGIGLTEYVQHVLEEQVSTRAEYVSPAERAAAWHASVTGLPLRPPLSDAAISRESIYDVRG